MLALALTSGAAERDYRFDGKISREVLENYLSRAVTLTDFLHGKGSVPDNLRFLTNTGAKFVGRAIYRWGDEDALPALIETAKPIARQAHQADPDMILQAACFEIVTTSVDKLPVPEWLFRQISWFAHQPEPYRNEWLRYAWKWVREHDSNGWLEMPGSRTLHAPVGNQWWYWANTRSAATPEVFNQEETIKAIWAEDRAEQPAAKRLPSLPPPGDSEANLFSRSLVSTGHLARLERALAKARRGEAVTVGVIGGSITAGAGASLPERRYGDRVAAWWRQTFPKATVRFVNAGIGATGSDYGALRAKRDLLSHHPDFVVVEYAVNDPNTQAAAESLEGLVRQVLRETNQPAVLLLFTMNQEGANAQEWQAKVGQHYGLPMVSFRDALWPEIKEGPMKWSDVEADVVHPNDRGHDYCARFVAGLLDRVLADLPPDDRLPQVKPVPRPLFSDTFEHVALFEADALKPLTNQGWSCDAGQPGDKYWKAGQPGSVIEFEVAGQVVLFMDWHIRGPMGQASVRVDDQPPVIREGWFDQTWGGYRQTTVLARDLGPGKHKVRIELLSAKNPQSTGHEFRVLGVGAAGAGPEN